MGIFWVLVLLMTAVDVKHLLLSSEEKGSFCEKERRKEILQKLKEKERREEILQKLKEEEVKIQLLHLHFKKAIAELEAKQKALTRPALSLERTILQLICKVLFSVAFMLFRPWE